MLALPLLPLELIYSAIPLAGFVIFLLLYAAVVNNPNVSRFIRFNTLQAILLDILLFVVSLVMNLVAQGLEPACSRKLSTT
ncbi:MAG: hypothetical protein HC787_10510 [Nostocaceae cyanobacterium CSU_2_110]|nr:hypothetical protein [Nostocaceae cyanobacterium CSU_2_110]